MTTSKNQKYLRRAFFDKVERANSYAYKSQVFVGEPSDFIVIIKDSIHKNDGKQPTPTAGKYICYGKGQIFDDFIENGIVYKEGSFFVSEDVAPKSEKKTLPHKKREKERESMIGEFWRNVRTIMGNMVLRKLLPLVLCSQRQSLIQTPQERQNPKALKKETSLPILIFFIFIHQKQQEKKEKQKTEKLNV